MKQELQQIWEDNCDALEIIAAFLITNPKAVEKELVEEISKSCGVSSEYAFYVILCALCGIEEDRSKKEEVIAREYLLPSIHRLEAEKYKENPYYKNIRIPNKKWGRWELKEEQYAPYEAFICNDLVIKKDYREIPQLGFFEDSFSFPAVLEEGNEWMTITPNEIETMQPALDVIRGKVITFGLGLGYFAYMASEKEAVEYITVVERDPEVIRLITENVLPQFPNRDKVQILCEDAFSFITEGKAEEYDFAFVDLWHDASDGVPCYLKIKKLEKYCPNTEFLYWIEETLLSGLRFKVMKVLSGEEKEQEIQAYLEQFDPDELAHCLSKEQLRELAKQYLM